MSYHQILFVAAAWLAAALVGVVAVAIRWYEGFGTNPIRLRAFQLAGVASFVIARPNMLAGCMGVATAVAVIWWGLLGMFKIQVSWDHFATILLLAPAIGYFVIFGMILVLGRSEIGKPESKAL